MPLSPEACNRTFVRSSGLHTHANGVSARVCVLSTAATHCVMDAAIVAATPVGAHGIRHERRRAGTRRTPDAPPTQNGYCFFFLGAGADAAAVSATFTGRAAADCSIVLDMLEAAGRADGYPV